MVKFKVVDKYEAIKAMLNGEVVEGFTKEDAATFLDERIAITEKKNASGAGADRKPTKEQIANEGVRTEILTYLANCDAPQTATDVAKGVGISQNKATALMRPLLTEDKDGNVNPNGKIVRTMVKGKALFALATEE